MVSNEFNRYWRKLCPDWEQVIEDLIPGNVKVEDFGLTKKAVFQPPKSRGIDSILLSLKKKPGRTWRLGSYLEVAINLTPPGRSMRQSLTTPIYGDVLSRALNQMVRSSR